MFNRKSRKGVLIARAVVIEGLEGRRLLSVNPMHGAASIEFNQAPAAVQTGLTSLAAADGFAAPTATTSVYLANSNGVEEYSIEETSTGKDTLLTVNVGGTAVMAPTTSSTTFGSLTTTVANEFDAIASALSLTAPSSTTNVAVLTPSDGTAIYTINLSSSSGHAKTPISVDANGNPVGNEVVPFSTLPTALQQQFITDAPSGVTLTSASTKPVQVAYVDGVQTYTVVFKTVGTTTTITLNGSGVLTSLPSQSVTEFSDIPAAAQTELQTLATADGAGTISTTQKVKAFTEANGTTIYTVRIKTTSGDTTLTISSDEDGNATVPPQDGPGPGGPPPGGPGGGPGGMPGGCGQNNSSSSESSSGDSDSSSSSSDSTTTTESTSGSSTSDDSGSTDSGSSDDGNGSGTGKGPGGHGPPPPPPPPHGR